uniref:NAM-associated domain-containing protein n=1 Tax=Haemonchus contortus TaxID=6289 RepID=A0A7I4Z4D9_HAECO
MGYLVSGPKLENKRGFQVSQQLQDEAIEWEKLWSMDLIQQYTISSTENKIPHKEDKEKMGKDIDKINPDQNDDCPQGKNTMEVQAKDYDEMTMDNLRKERKIERTTDDEYLLRLISETAETADNVERMNNLSRLLIN